MKKTLAIVVIIIVVIIVIVVSRRGGKQQTTSVTPTASQEQTSVGTGQQVGTQIGDLAPDFQLVDYSGKKVALSDLKGKSPVFVNFWASWCPFCVNELPLMSRVQGKFSGKYITLAINRGESQSTGQKFAEKVGVAGKFVFLNDPSDSIYAKYSGFAMPYSIFIDKQGVIRELKLGPLSDSELEQKLQAILK